MRLNLRDKASNCCQIGKYLLLTILNPEQALDLNNQEKLLLELKPVASRGFGREVTEESLKKHVFTDQDLLILAMVENFPVGFAGVISIPSTRSGVFLTGITLLPEHQGQGLGSAILKLIIKTSNCRICAYTTQSPIMYLLLTRLSKIVYPQIDDPFIPYHIQQLGSTIIKGRRGNFNSEIFVSKDLYPHCLYPKNFPWCSESKINEFFRSRLEFKGNKTKDGFLLIGKIF